MRSLAIALLSISSMALAACAHTPAVCEAPGDASCGLDAAWERRISEPQVMAVVSAHDPLGALPRTVTFGSKAWGKTALYLRFAQLGVAPQRIKRAFLRLEPASTGPADASGVKLEVWRVRRAWQPGTFDWASQPTLGPPHSSGESRGRAAVRIDVTELVRDSEQHPQRSHGLAVLARDGDGHGVSYVTGSGDPWLPRLEVYLR